LTPIALGRENRSFCKVAICFLLICSAAAARADGDCPLHETRTPDLAARWSRAALMPKLALGVRGSELALTGLAARSIEVFAWVRWPLERRIANGLSQLGALAQRRQERAEEAAARARALEQIRRRPRGVDLRAQIDDQLDEEEARAELAAMGCP
jgi:hypothetical protein